MNLLIPWPTSFHCFQSHLLRAIYFHLQFTLLVLYLLHLLVIALTIIISISSPSSPPLASHHLAYFEITITSISTFILHIYLFASYLIRISIDLFSLHFVLFPSCRSNYHKYKTPKIFTFLV